MFSAIIDFLLGLIGLSRRTAEEKLGQQETQNAINQGIAEAEGKAIHEEHKVASLADASVDSSLRSEFTRK